MENEILKSKIIDKIINELKTIPNLPYEEKNHFSSYDFRKKLEAHKI